MKSDYIIDFERVNELSVHPNDNPNSPSLVSGYCYSTTRKIIKDCLDIYLGNGNIGNRSEEKYNQAVETLHYNRILISKADLRDDKINEILE